MSVLGTRGHKVRIYSPISTTEEDIGVIYLNLSEFGSTNQCDLLIHFRQVYPEYIENNFCTINIFWSTDIPHSSFMPVDFTSIDHVLCISPFHERMLLAFYPTLTKSKTTVMGLGVIEHDYFDDDLSILPVKRGNRLVYCSVPGRGLAHLGRLFPEIQERVADAELFITSDYSLWGRKPGTEGYRSLFSNQHNVNFLGNVPRAQLLEIQKSSKVMAYPNIFAEGFCLSALECMAAGTVPVTSAYGALINTVGEGGVLLPGCPGQRAYDGAFVEAIERILSDDDYRTALALTGRHQVASGHTWDIVADRFERQAATLLR